jgi:1,4-alpha-glucan branching enzyme
MYKSDATSISKDDLYLFNEGSHFRLYDKLGAHLLVEGGTHFSVWAPNAEQVSVIGDFNGWEKERSPSHSEGQFRHLGRHIF